MPKRRRTSVDCLMGSRPSIWMLPLVGVNSVVSILIVVVFPAPLGPRNAKISPAFTSSEMSSTADTSPYFFTRLVMRIMCGRMLQIRAADFQRNVLLKADAASIALARACRDQRVHGIRAVERPDCSERFCRLRGGQRALRARQEFPAELRV